MSVSGYAALSGFAQSPAPARSAVASRWSAAQSGGAAEAAMLDIDQLDGELRNKQREKRKRQSSEHAH